MAVTVRGGAWRGVVAARPHSAGPASPEAAKAAKAAKAEPPLSVLPRELMLWFFQTVAALPSRDIPAPVVVYAVVLSTWAAVTVLAVRQGARHERLALTFVLASAVPLATTAAFYASDGTVWQGRYGCPSSMGVLLIGTAVLDRGARDGGSARIALVLAALASLVASEVGLRFLLDFERRRSPLAGTDLWHPPPTWWALVAVAAGTTVIAAALHPRRTTEDVSHAT